MDPVRQTNFDQMWRRTEPNGQLHKMGGQYGKMIDFEHPLPFRHVSLPPPINGKVDCDHGRAKEYFVESILAQNKGCQFKVCGSKLFIF